MGGAEEDAFDGASFRFALVGDGIPTGVAIAEPEFEAPLVRGGGGFSLPAWGQWVRAWD